MPTAFLLSFGLSTGLSAQWQDVWAASSKQISNVWTTCAVGHSFGGYNVRVYTGLYPNEVSGVVLVDSSHEDQERFEASERKTADGLQTLAPFVPILRFFGVLWLRDRLWPTTITGSELSQATMQELSASALAESLVRIEVPSEAEEPEISQSAVSLAERSNRRRSQTSSLFTPFGWNFCAPQDVLQRKEAIDGEGHSD